MENTVVSKVADIRQIEECLALAWEVFQDFDATDCTAEGIDEFRCFVSERWREQPMEFYTATLQGRSAGMLAMRLPSHISLLFVKKEFHGRGTARALVEAMLLDHKDEEITVNSAPYAVEIYKALGFVTTAGEQCVNGIRFTPMKMER